MQNNLKFTCSTGAAQGFFSGGGGQNQEISWHRCAQSTCDFFALPWGFPAPPSCIQAGAKNKHKQVFFLHIRGANISYRWLFLLFTISILNDLDNLPRRTVVDPGHRPKYWKLQTLKFQKWYVLKHILNILIFVFFHFTFFAVCM